MTPVYIVLGVMLYKWSLKNQSGELAMSKDDFSAFNSQEGEVKKASTAGYDPNLSDIGLTLHYKSGGSKSGTQEELDWGYKEGYLLEFLGGNLNNAKALDELFSNKWMIQGFMGRRAVKKALASPEALQEFLGDPGTVNDFLADRTITAALNSPQVVNVLSQSDMAKTLLAAPAFQGLISNPDAVQELAGNNPKIMALLRRPEIRAAIMASPQTGPLAAALGWKKQ
ncbi:MAG TPA: hypothetical protein DCZ92_12965 [Elusimicrobia bacterium]|nr:hypothetical protein [Elusimicrobiota bacterium]